MHQKTSSEWLLPPLEEWSGNKLRPAALGLFIASGSLMVLLHGAGLGSWTTAAVLIGPLCVLALNRGYRNTLTDTLFFAFLGAVALSTSINGPGEMKEEALLCISLAAYPAARRGGEAGLALFVVVGAIGCIGAVITAITLVQQWDNEHGRPIIFGQFNAAPAQFFSCIAIVLLGAVAANLSRRHTIIIYAVAGLALVVFGASLLRFAFFALAGTLLLEGLVCRRTRTKAIWTALFVLAAGGVGELSKHNMALSSAQVSLEAISGPSITAPPSGQAAPECVGVNQNNSISIRLGLLKDANEAMRKAGLWGNGLGNFAASTCIGLPPHVTLFQVIIEFGWLAGILLLLAWAAAVYYPLWMERPEARFAFMGLINASLLTLAHGDLARSGLFFLFLGYLARISEEPL